jgi:O-antigen biosynthesis protein
LNSAKPVRLPDHASAGRTRSTAGPTSLPESGRIALLRLKVHADAFRYDPLGYLQAVAWRSRGLRLRSRNRIASLAGRSSHAYELWIARDEPEAMAAVPRSVDGNRRILGVIDCRHGVEGLDATLASFPVDSSVVLLGGPRVYGVPRVDRPADLAQFVDSSAQWLCILNAGDVLAASAIDIYAAAAEQAGTSLVIYSDDDLIGADGLRREPFFKPDWNADLFEHHDFVSGSAILKVEAGVLGDLPEQDWVHVVVSRAAAAAAAAAGGEPVHLPIVLHHRKARPSPIVPAKPAQPILANPPSLTAIVPTRNHVQLLRTCIEGLRRANYPNMETIVIDNGSDDPEAISYLRQLEAGGTMVLSLPGRFNFSLLNNEAVKRARGEMLSFLNNDVEMLDDADWLSLLVRQAMRQDIGAVGARLLYPDGTVQHAGVCTGIGGGAAHAHRFQGADEPGYFERTRLPQRVSAVTAACLVVAKEKFLAVGGFDEQEFPVAFNDVDLCLKLNERGWQSFYEPRATLIHHESKSRGNDAAKNNRVRFAGELAALKRKWKTDISRDPYHHPHLSPFCEQFLLAV